MVVPGSSWLWLWYGYGSSWMFLVVRPISIFGGGTLPAQPNTAFLLSRKSSFVGAQAGLSMFHFFIHNSFVSLLTTSEHIEPKVFIFHNISDANEFYRYAHKASTQDKCGRWRLTDHRLAQWMFSFLLVASLVFLWEDVSEPFMFGRSGVEPRKSMSKWMLQSMWKLRWKHKKPNT